MAKYSLETKLKAVTDVLELGMSPGVVAKSLNTSKVVVRGWGARYEIFGVDGLTMKAGIYSGDFKVRVNISTRMVYPFLVRLPTLKFQVTQLFQNGNVFIGKKSPSSIQRQQREKTQRD